MPRARQTHHCVLYDSASANKVGLKLLRDEKGQLAYSWRLLPEEALSQDNWQDGAFAYRHSPETPNMYALADGVWAATEHEASLGPYVQPCSFGVRNGGAELKATTYFTATGLTATWSQTGPFAGASHFTLASSDANDKFETDVPNPGRYSGRAVRFSCWARVASGSATARLNIVETPAATTNGTAVALTTTYQRLTVNATLGDSLTVLNVEFEVTVGTNVTIYMDELTCEDSYGTTRADFQPFHEMGGTLLCVTLNAVWSWDDTDDYWVLEAWLASAITGARMWDNRLFVGHGPSTAYDYSTAGNVSDTNAAVATIANWTASTAADPNAQQFGLGRTAGSTTFALYKTLDPDSLKVSANPVNGGTAWGSQIEVGFNDRSITGVHEAFGHIFVGKEDGFYVYATLDYETNPLGMTNVAEGLQYTVGDSSFSRSALHQGWFYALTGDRGFWRYNKDVWQDMQPVIETPGFSELQGMVTSLGSDGQWLYLTLQDEAAAGTGKESWLVVMREHPSQGWEVHTIAKVKMNQAYGWGFLTNTTSRFSFVLGNISTQQVVYRIWHGQNATTPRLTVAATRQLMVNATLITPYFNLGTKRTMNRLTVIQDGATAEFIITGAYELDDQTSFTNINSTSSVFDTSPSETIAFNSGVSGRRIRLRFSWTGGQTSTSVLRRFILYPTRLKEWRLVAALETDQDTLQGVPYGMTAAKMISFLDTLRGSVDDAPLQFEDIDGTVQRCTIQEMREVNHAQRPVGTGAIEYNRAIELVLREAVA